MIKKAVIFGITKSVVNHFLEKEIMKGILASKRRQFTLGLMENLDIQ